MKVKVLTFVVAALLTIQFVSQAQSSTNTQQRTTAFVNVNVIPMDRERVLNNQTVVIRDGRIAEIGDAAKVKVPNGAVQIDGRGKYLIPGLADMHTHLFSDDEFPDALAGDELAVMIANGVTTIRLMIGTPEHLVMRKKIAQGEMLGPTLYVASPQLAGKSYGKVFNGYVVTNAEEARRAVLEAKAAGYDFIKLTISISPEVYDAVIQTAKEVGIRVVGHVDLRVGLQHALNSGEHLEHLDSYMEAVLKDDAPSKVSVSDTGVWRKPNWSTLDYVDERKIAEVSKATAKAGIYTCPTLTFFKMSFAVEQSDDEIRARPDFRFFPVYLREPLLAAHKRFWADPPSAERRATYQRVRNKLVKSIHEAGGKIMVGSDTPELFLLYGYTVHREMQNLVEAGLSPYAALEAATRIPAEFLKSLNTSGTIERGKRADLVLLNANPLDNIANTERRAGVMVHGRWLSDADLQKMLNEAAAKFEKVTNKKE